MPENNDPGLAEYNTLTIVEALKANNTGTPMPEYQSHKKVWALKIKKVHRDEWGIGIAFELPQFAMLAFTNDQLKGKPTPQDGWYYVRYKDGYFSFSPAKEFEEGHTRI